MKLAALSLAVLLGTCATPGWQGGRRVVADPRRVAVALGDPTPSGRLVIGDLPELEPPHHARTCCAFGMDLEVDFAGMQVPFFSVGNIIATEELGTHAYSLGDAAPDPEGNGLVYTCRAGWVDVAHVRENADNLLFLTLRIASDLETGGTFEIPGHGGTASITVRPVPASLLAREGPLAIAGALAAWTAFRLSIWHEVSTWYGYQMVAGFSEQPSAFSLEDLYSNALGIRLGLAVIEERGFDTDEDYDVAIAAFIGEALDRLEAQPAEVSRAIMTSLDGRWWDSTRRLPDNLLVRRRAFPPSDGIVRPWRAEQAFRASEIPAALEEACRGAATRPLELPVGVGRTAARDLVSIRWAPESWAEGTLPFADPAHLEVTEDDLDRLVADARAQMEATLGVGFDEPGPRDDAR